MTTTLYHGSNRPRGERMLIGKEKIISRGDGHWLGDGLYLFVDFIYAYKWIVDMYADKEGDAQPKYNQLINKYMIIEYDIMLSTDRLFDLTNPEHKILFDFTLKQMKSKQQISNKVMPEGVVLNYMFEELSYNKLFDAIKALFMINRNQYNFKSRLGFMPQYQLCIRNLDIVKTLTEHNFEDKVEEYNQKLKKCFIKVIIEPKKNMCINFNGNEGVMIMDLKTEMKRIEKHFDNIDVEEFEKRLKKHGMEEIKAMNHNQMSFYEQRDGHPIYDTKNIYSDMKLENSTFHFSNKSNIEVA